MYLALVGFALVVRIGEMGKEIKDIFTYKIDQEKYITNLKLKPNRQIDT